jgi:hypothetical protein
MVAVTSHYGYFRGEEGPLIVPFPPDRQACVTLKPKASGAAIVRCCRLNLPFIRSSTGRDGITPVRSGAVELLCPETLAGPPETIYGETPFPDTGWPGTTAIPSTPTT